MHEGDKDANCARDGRRPPVPKATDHIATPYRTRRNFVHKNALDAMLSEPPGKNSGEGDEDSSDVCYVDSPRGNTQVHLFQLKSVHTWLNRRTNFYIGKRLSTNSVDEHF